MADDPDVIELLEMLDKYAKEEALTSGQTTVLTTLDTGVANSIQLAVVKKFTKSVVDPVYEELSNIVDEDILATMDDPSIPSGLDEMRMLDKLDGQGATGDTVSALFDKWKAQRQEFASYAGEEPIDTVG